MRQQGRIMLPERTIFLNAYKVLSLPCLPSRTKETILQTPRRTVWMHNKDFKSCMVPGPACLRWEEPETMEHLLHACGNYRPKFVHEPDMALHGYFLTYPSPSSRRHHLGMLILFLQMKFDIIFWHAHFTTLRRGEKLQAVYSSTSAFSSPQNHHPAGVANFVVSLSLGDPLGSIKRESVTFWPRPYDY
jgi:hypothetical protein